MPIYSNYKNTTTGDTNSQQQVASMSSSMAVTGTMPQNDNQDGLSYVRNDGSSSKAGTPYHDRGRKGVVINKMFENNKDIVKEQTTEYLQSTDLQ